MPGILPRHLMFFHSVIDYTSCLQILYFDLQSFENKLVLSVVHKMIIVKDFRANFHPPSLSPSRKLRFLFDRFSKEKFSYIESQPLKLRERCAADTNRSFQYFWQSTLPPPTHSTTTLPSSPFPPLSFLATPCTSGLCFWLYIAMALCLCRYVCACSYV